MQGRGRLRIIGGTAGGRRLRVPRGRAVRPTPDRVREALFSILGDRCRDAAVADVCAGTGALGLEALSRGARRALFIERDLAVASVLRENISRLGLEGAEVMVRDAVSLLGELGRGGEVFDLFFVDPPYGRELFEPLVETIAKGELLALEGLVVVEHPTDKRFTFRGLKLVDERRYGSVALTFWENG